LTDVISLPDQLGSRLCLDQLAVQVDWCLNDFVLLGLDLHFECDLLEEGLESTPTNRFSGSLGHRFSDFAVVFPEREVNPVPDNVELGRSKLLFEVPNLSLLTDVSPDPLRFVGFFALVIDKLTAKLEAGADYVVAFKWQPAELRVSSDHTSHDVDRLLMHVVHTVVDLNVSLEGFNDFFVTIWGANLDNDLEGKLLQGHDLVAKVARVLIYWNPDGHCMGLYQRVQSVDIQPIVDVSFKSSDVLDTTDCMPVLKFVFQPPVLFQDFESLLTSQKLGNEDIHVVCVSFNRDIRLTTLIAHFVLRQKLLLGYLDALHPDECLNVLGLKQEVDRDLIEASFFKHAESYSLDVLVSFEQVVAQEGQAPAVEVKVTLSIQLSVGLNDAFGEVAGALVRPLFQQVSCWRVGDSEVK
jgi:hypothetical protein